MNRDQVKGVGKHIKGEAQQQLGKLTGDSSTRLRGQAKELEGRLQKNVGDMKEELRSNQRELDRATSRQRSRDR